MTGDRATGPAERWPGVPEGGLRLGELTRELPGGGRIVGDAGARVFGVHHDSRKVTAGDLFYARAGARTSGARFVEDAVARGAVAVLAEEGTALPDRDDVPRIYVRDGAGAFAHAAAAVYGHPSFTLEVVGVTGTNGKTTVTHLVQSAIDGVVGHPSCGVIGTVGHTFAGARVEAEHTTPEADEIARVMARFRAAGAHHVAMEVSSIALALGRARAVRFRVAAFTNLTQDHLDFHGSMEAYGAAKALLFEAMGPGAAVVNVGDPFGRDLCRRVRAPLLRVSAEVGAPDGTADVAPTQAALTARGIDATFRTPGGEVRLRSRLVGAHNLENLAVALGVACSLELDLGRAAEALSRAAGAPGRLERCDDDDDDLRVLVDYAHTPDAVAKVLASVRAVTPMAGGARLWAIVGCGGDRDPTKRAPMGRAAAGGADVVLVTSDNPRTEDPAAIARAVEEGVRAGGRTGRPLAALGDAPEGYAVVLERREAIASAAQMAKPGDVVLLLGKGHETYQIVGHDRRPFDDRVVAREALRLRKGGAP